jgi:hypothetical protein
LDEKALEWVPSPCSFYSPILIFNVLTLLQPFCEPQSIATIRSSGSD